MPAQYLAQLNIGRLAGAKDGPEVAEFINNLDRINAIAERSPGFVWRLKDDAGNATDIPVTDDPRVIINISVWADVEKLEHFVWNTLHQSFYKRRTAWFEPWTGPHFALWFVDSDKMPTVEEGLARLSHLAVHGPSDHVFGWADIGAAKIWRERRCA
jgi:Domain of unknown function (DUF3291)